MENDLMIKEELKKIFLELLNDDADFRNDVIIALSNSENFSSFIGEAYENYKDDCRNAEAAAWV